MAKVRPPYKKPESPSMTADQKRRIDKHRRVAREWYERRQPGQRPSRDTQHAIDQVRKVEREAIVWESLNEIPQKCYLAGAQVRANQARDQLQRFGFPWGKHLSFFEFVHRFHNFLAEHQHRLLISDDERTEEAALISCRWERAKILKLERLEMEGTLVSRDEQRKALNHLAVILRGAGEHLQRYHGADAAAILTEAIDEFEKSLGRWQIESGGNGETAAKTKKVGHG